MGAKDWMLFYAEQDIPTVLRERPAFDHAATTELVNRLFPRHSATAIDDVTLLHGNPPDDEVYAAVWPGATLVCTAEAGIDNPTALHPRVIEAGAGRTTYLHAMHSVVDWFAFALWAPNGHLRRALSLSPDDGIIENIGHPLPFEAPFWAGDHPAIDPEDDDQDDPYPFIFHPLELAETTLGTLFGFVYEGPPELAVVDPDDIPLAAFNLTPRRRKLFTRTR
jgi:hypothetical protein